MNNILEINIAPFAPVFGYIMALVAVVSMIWALFWRGVNICETPKDIVPRAARGAILTILGIGMVLLWLNITPETLNYDTKLSIYLGIILIIAFMVYHPFTRAYTFEKEVASCNREK